MEDALSVSAEGVKKEANSIVATPTTAADTAQSNSNLDYSQTNTQVLGVDESEITKTDGKYIYYVSDYYDTKTGANPKYVYVVKATPANSMEVVRKIKIPDTFSNVELYLTDNKLVILANGYTQGDYSWYWFDRNTKTYVMVMDTTDFKLQKLSIIDGNYNQSRRIGDYLYVITQNSLQFPYYAYKAGATDYPEFDVKKSLPKEIEITRTNDTTKQNLTLG